LGETRGVKASKCSLDEVGKLDRPTSARGRQGLPALTALFVRYVFNRYAKHIFEF